jgi:hypothetical protein
MDVQMMSRGEMKKEAILSHFATIASRCSAFYDFSVLSF